MLLCQFDPLLDLVLTQGLQGRLRERPKLPHEHFRHVVLYPLHFLMGNINFLSTR